LKPTAAVESLGIHEKLGTVSLKLREEIAMRLCLGKRVLQGVGAGVLALVVGTAPAFAAYNPSVKSLNCPNGDGAYAGFYPSSTGTATFTWTGQSQMGQGTSITYRTVTSGDVLNAKQGVPVEVNYSGQYGVYLQSVQMSFTGNGSGFAGGCD